MRQEIIKKIIEEYFRINIKRDTRKKQYTEARAFYYKFCKIYTKESLDVIGRLVGRDHACVINGLKRLDGWLTYDKRVLAYYSELDRLIKEALEDFKEDYLYASVEKLYEAKYTEVSKKYKDLLARYDFLVSEIKDYDTDAKGMLAKVKKDKFINNVNDLIEKPIV